LGHFPNKARKEAEQARLAAKQRRRAPAQAVPTCRCGLTYLEVPIMWSIGTDHRTPAELYCPACLPAKYIPLVAREVANLPSDE